MNKIELEKLNLFDFFPDAVFVTDCNFNVIYLNSLMEQILGNEFDLKNLKIHDFLPEIDKFDENNQIITKFSVKSGKNLSVRVKLSEFKKNYFIFTLIPLNEFSFLSQAHSDFVSTVSHELRTPLTSLKGFVDTLIVSGSRLSEEQKSRFLFIIKSQIERLNRLVENLLEVSRLESNTEKLILKTVNLNKVVDNIIQTLKINADNHQFLKKINKNIPDLFVDSDKLEQILVNLLDNAIKYSYPKSKIIISADIFNNEYIKIKIEDEGVGIPLDKIKDIFTKFSRIDNPLTRQVQGTGLGLYITKILVENLGGKIFAETKEKGSIFSVILPMSNSENSLKKANIC